MIVIKPTRGKPHTVTKFLSEHKSKPNEIIRSLKMINEMEAIAVYHLCGLELRLSHFIGPK